MGAVLDVVVDIRSQSPTFRPPQPGAPGCRDGNAAFCSKGFLHGFCTLEPDTEVVYKVSAFYAPEADFSVLWNDPDLGIDWPVPADKAILSAKDAEAPRLRDIPGYF